MASVKRESEPHVLLREVAERLKSASRRLCSPEKSALQLFVNRDKTVPALTILHAFCNLLRGCVTTR